MRNDKEKKPDWVENSLRNLKEIRTNIEPVYQAGRKEIQQGLEKIHTVNKLNQEIDYIERTLAQDCIPREFWNDEYVTASGVQLSNTLGNFSDSTSRIPGLAAKAAIASQEQHHYIVLALNSTTIPSGTATYLSAGIERRFESINPNYEPILLVNPPDRLGSRDLLLAELEVKVTVHGERFINMLNGSEQALYQKNPDHLSQAAHSMRDLFQQLIEYIAPTNVVKEQPWFQPIPRTPDGVSRKQRLRYMLYGSGEGYDESMLNQLDETANNAKEALDLAIARAHDHDPSLSPEEVKTSIDLARFSLNEVLKVYADRKNLE